MGLGIWGLNSGSVALNLQTKRKRRLGGFSPPKDNIGALIIRIKFWSPVYYNYKKEPTT